MGFGFRRQRTIGRNRTAQMVVIPSVPDKDRDPVHRSAHPYILPSAIYGYRLPFRPLRSRGKIDLPFPRSGRQDRGNQEIMAEKIDVLRLPGRRVLRERNQLFSASASASRAILALAAARTKGR